MTTHARVSLEPGEPSPKVHVRAISTNGIAWVDAGNLTVQSSAPELLEALADALHLAARGLREMRSSPVMSEDEPIGACVVGEA